MKENVNVIIEGLSLDRIDEVKSGDRYYGGLPAEPSAAEYGKAMSSIAQKQKDELAKFEDDFERVKGTWLTKDDLYGAKAVFKDKKTGIKFYITDHGKSISITHTPEKGGGVTSIEVNGYNGSSFADALAYIKKNFRKAGSVVLSSGDEGTLKYYKDNYSYAKYFTIKRDINKPYAMKDIEFKCPVCNKKMKIAKRCPYCGQLFDYGI